MACWCACLCALHAGGEDGHRGEEAAEAAHDGETAPDHVVGVRAGPWWSNTGSGATSSSPCSSSSITFYCC